MAKICSKCLINKELICFRIRKNTNKTNKIYYRSICIECEKKYDKSLKIKNKDKISINRKLYYINNKIKENNNSKDYYKNNKADILKKNNIYYSNRMRIDPCFKLRNLVAGSIKDSLSNRLSLKNNFASWKYIEYTKYELKEHLEKQFEPWMNWQNWGSYKVTLWDDNDQSTWKWNLDHIIPHYNFKYTSMEDQSFKDCWALSNLRPYSAKQNILDGRRIKIINIQEDEYAI